MFDDIISKLDENVIDWYKNTESSNIISALTIGMNVVTSNDYKTSENDIVNKLRDTIKILENNTVILEEEYETNIKLERVEFKNQLQKEKLINRELESKFEIDNEHSIKVCVELATNNLMEHIGTLKELNNKKDEELLLVKNEYNSLKCNMKTSKTKGEITEKEVTNVIESNGFSVKKAGIHSGDLFVYYEEELVSILEIKNYNDDNKYKLGPSGSETKKMYNDIETYLGTKDSKNVPWIFISLGCKIPKMIDLRNSHCGVKCMYLDLPTDKEIIAYIKFCHQLSQLNSKKNDKNIIYMQQKINEIYDIFNKLQEDRPDFNGIKDILNKSMRKLDKEDSKYNKLLEDTINRVNEIIKDIKYSPNNDNDIDYTINSGELSIDKLKEYVKKLQRNSIQLNRQLNNYKIKNKSKVELSDNNVKVELADNNVKVKCEYCNAMVKNIKKHHNTVTCQKKRGN